jgi:ABC-type Mn2+/Zn2+ transport system permease subunit
MVGILTVLLLVICGLIAMSIGQTRRRGLAESFFFGLLLGPIGVLCVAVLKPSYPKGGPGGWSAPPEESTHRGVS